MTQKKDTFEERLLALEELVKELETGGMPLDKTLKAYEQGEKLAESLKKDLQSAEERLTVLRGDDA
ncbi:MAG: exodeoxyribonuclease VII small subunit [Thermoguttaceae bacterium]|nr:exodeoxyribonuclease VII small subunit [Clostridia bacterium]MBR6436098.1 exodeoxyribonuclease VII small subunit [Thermoguttaceae bacterium]